MGKETLSKQTKTFMRNTFLITLILVTILSLSLSSAYNAVVNVSTTSLGNIRSDFYGTNQKGIWGSNTSWIDTNNDQYLDADSNYTYFREKILEANFDSLQMGVDFYQHSEGNNLFNTTVINDNYANILTVKNSIEWAYNNNIKVYLAPVGVPDWLANKTVNGGFCNVGTLVQNSSCAPYNYSLYGDNIVNYIDFLTNNGQWNSSINLQFMVEPFSGTKWLNNLTTDNITRATEYVRLYNITYWKVKAKYPNMEIGLGDIGISVGTTPKFAITSLSNLTGQYSFITIDSYSNANRTFYNGKITNDLINLYSNCTTYGSNCNNLHIGEWNVGDIISKNTSSQYTAWGNIISEVYSAILNYKPNITTPNFYQLSEQYSYNNNSANYFQFPSKYHMLLDTNLNSKDKGEITTPYNITKIYATTHKAGNTVYNSSSSNSSLKVVTSKDGSKTYITVTNTLSEGVNITLNTGLVNSNSYLRDVETNTIYPLGADGIAQINNLGGYGVLTLDSNPVVINTPFTTSLGNIRSDFYGVQAGDYFSQYNNVSNDMDCTRESISNYTNERNDYLSAGLTISRKDMQLAWGPANINLNSTFDPLYPRNDIRSNILWANLTNTRFILVSKSMPDNIANKTSNLLNCSSDTTTCMYTNITRWCYANVNYINNITENGKYLSSIEAIEIGNEMENPSFFLSGLSTSSGNMSVRSLYYNQMYNETYDCIKSYFPTLKVIGSGNSALDVSQGQNMFLNWLRNFSNKQDGVSFHDYHYDGTNLTDVAETIDWVKQQCDLYSINCSRFYLGEWNLQNKTLMRQNYAYSFISSNLAHMLNKYYNSLTQMFWKFDVGYLNESCDSSYNFSMYSQFDRSGVAYNITKTFASQYAVAGSTVYNSSSNLNGIKVVSSRISNACNVIITNTYNENQSIVYTFDTSLCGSQLIDTSNGNLISNGSTVILDNYGVKYLTTPFITSQESGYNIYSNYLGEYITRYAIDEHTPTCSNIFNAFGEFGDMIGVIILAIVIVIAIGYLTMAKDVDSNLIVIGVLSVTLAVIVLVMGSFVLEALCNIR